jgi:hypothetical protein
MFYNLCFVILNVNLIELTRCKKFLELRKTDIRVRKTRTIGKHALHGMKLHKASFMHVLCE